MSAQGSFKPERFRAVLDHIVANPGEWNQREYLGIPCCFAGHAARMSGALPDVVTDFDAYSAAGRWLGLTFGECALLFDAKATISTFESFLRSKELQT